MFSVATPAWVRFLRSYGPVPSNDNMYDESIQRALRRTKLKPLVLPAQFVEELLANFRAEAPRSFILTGTAGDGKTYHCREVWRALGGSLDDWNAGAKVQRLPIGSRELVVVKDLSELSDDEGGAVVRRFATDVIDPNAQRVYLVAANHGQLLEKLKASADAPAVRALTDAVEALMVTGRHPSEQMRFDLRDLSRSPAADLLVDVVREIVGHEAWAGCESCGSAPECPIRANRSRMMGDGDGGRMTSRLRALVDVSEHNGHHFPIRQLLVLATNMLLGHPDARDGLMSCGDVPGFVAAGTTDRASVYRNVFGENLKPSRAERTEPFGKLALFGIGVETSNAIDSVLVYGADDPKLEASYAALMLADARYGATPAFQSAQRAYLEGRDAGAEDRFLHLLRAQRQRLFFTMPDGAGDGAGVWELTIFKFAGDFLSVADALRDGKPTPRESLGRLVRGLNRVFSGMLVQTQDELILATSGTHAQTRTSPLLDDKISVTRKGGEEVALNAADGGGVGLSIRFTRDDNPPAVELVLTPTRYEFLNRVAQGALPSSFSLECHEDFLALKARLLSAAERRRALDGPPPDEALELQFLELASDGRAGSRRVSVRL
jgi:hypothetical protein